MQNAKKQKTKTKTPTLGAAIFLGRWVPKYTGSPKFLERKIGGSG